MFRSRIAVDHDTQLRILTEVTNVLPGACSRTNFEPDGLAIPDIPEGGGVGIPVWTDRGQSCNQLLLQKTVDLVPAHCNARCPREDHGSLLLSRDVHCKAYSSRMLPSPGHSDKTG